MLNIIIIVVIILLFLSIIGFIIFNKEICNKPIIKIYDSKKPGPYIIFISGTHGNELAPHYTINKYLQKYPPLIGKIKHITVNQCGILFNNREQGPFDFNKDVNRSYDSDNNLNKEIIKELQDSDLVVDFHESIGIHYFNKEHIGNTITFNTNFIDVRNLIQLLNKKFYNTNWKSYNTHIFKDNDWINGSLVQYCSFNNINYILIESYKGYNLDYRKNQINTILTYLYIKYHT